MLTFARCVSASTSGASISSATGFTISSARPRSDRETVNVRSVSRSTLAFWTIVSTLIPFSPASRSAAFRTARDRDAGDVHVLRDRHHPVALLHERSSVYQCTRRVAKAGGDVDGHPLHRPQLYGARVHH